MAALTEPRFGGETFGMTSITMYAKKEVAWRGGVAAIDLTSGLVCKGFESPNLFVIGSFMHSRPVARGGRVAIWLIRELIVSWMTPVPTMFGSMLIGPSKIGQFAYLVDDGGLVTLDGTGRSRAGRIWGTDILRGVMIENVDL